jgi:hypothetical protein
MTYDISEDRRTLTLRVHDTEEQDHLKTLRDEDENWGTTWMECEILEGMLANCGLQWVNPCDTGDLTDAPLLGELDSEENQSRIQRGPHGAVCVGRDEGGNWYCPILERWGYPSYALRSFLEDLADTGKVEFIDHW